MKSLSEKSLKVKIIEMILGLKKSYEQFSWWEKLLFFLLLMGICSITYFIFVGSRTIFNSDTATANLLAREQMRSMQFFPKQWVSADGPWTFFINLPMIPLSLFIKNQLLLRSTAVLIQTFFMLFVFYKFSKKIFIDNSYLVFATFVFSGISEYMLENIFGQAAYGYQIIYTLLLFYFATTSLDSNLKIKTKQLLIFIGLFYISCLSGTRQIAVFLIPFITATLIVFITENVDINVKTSIKAIKNFAKWFFVVLCSTILGIASFMFLLTKIDCKSGVSAPMIIDPNDIENLTRHISNFTIGFWQIFGYQKSVDLFSISGIFVIFKIVSAITLVFILPYLAMSKFSFLQTNTKRLMLYSWISFAIVLFLFIFCDVLSPSSAAIRYFQVFFTIQLIVSGFYIYNFLLKNNLIIKLIALSFIVLFVFMSFYETAKVSYNYSSKMDATNNLIEELKQHHLKLGYASYWNAYKNSVYSDFNPEIVAVIGLPLKPYYFLTSKISYNPNYYIGETFLLLTDSEYSTEYNLENLENQFGKPKEIIKISGYSILIYNYNISERFLFEDLINNESKNVMPFMTINGKANLKNKGNIILNRDDLIYGPYINLSKGIYELTFKCKMKLENQKNELKITANSGKDVISTNQIVSGSNNIQFEVDSPLSAVEFFIQNKFDFFEIEQIQIKKK